MKSKILFFFFFSSIAFCDTMMKYYDIALKNSHIVQEAKYNLEASKYNLDKVNSKKGISINWTITGSRNNKNSDIDSEDNIYNQENYNLDINKPIYNLNNNLELDKAKILNKIEQLKYKKALQQYSLDFLDKYFIVYKDKIYYQFAIKNERFATKLFKRAKKLFDNNLISEVDFLAVKANLKEATENLKLAKLKFEKSKNIFQIFLGGIKVEEFENFSIDSFDNLKFEYNNDYSNNFEIKIIDLEILSLKKELKALNRWYYPELNFNINYSKLKTQDPNSNNIEQLSGKLVLSGSLYKGGFTNSSQKNILALLKAKRSKKEFTNSMIHIRVNENILELKNNIAQFTIIKEKLIKSILELKVLEKKGRFGLIDFSKSMQVQNKILELENQKIDKAITILKLFVKLQYEFTLESKEVIDKLNNFLKLGFY